ncbi:MAG: site-specific integrase [Desulfovibrionaceae bacterium]|nr:site-specific integrase [Desulfovibrionaceae bacterium]
MSELDYPTIKVRLNELLLKLMDRVDHMDGLKLSLSTAQEPTRPVLGYHDLAVSEKNLKAVADGLLVKIDEDRMLARMTEDGAFSQLEASKSRKVILRSYPEFYEALRAYAFAHFKNDSERKARLKDEAELDIVRYKGLVPGKQPQAPAAYQASPQPGPAENTMLFSELVARYIEAKQSDNGISATTARGYQDKLNNFIEILGDLTLGQINKPKMREFRDKLRNLPPHRKKRKEYQDKSIDELLALNLPSEKTLTINHVNQTTGALYSLFKWAIDEELFHANNPVTNLRIKERTKAQKKRDPLTRTDIQKAFMDAWYLEDKHAKAAYFWAPLIALYTGMRVEEIAQLHMTDIYEHKDDEGKKVWVFDVRTESNEKAKTDKSLKNLNSTRIIPIHQDLKDIGLLEFRKRQPKRQTRLFQTLNRSGDKYGQQIGKQFAALLKRVGVKVDKKKTFHSLRHSFVDQFKKKGIYNAMASEVYGHNPDGTRVTNTYGGDFTPTEKYAQMISLLNYPLDIGMLSKSKYARGRNSK